MTGHFTIRGWLLAVGLSLATCATAGPVAAEETNEP